MKIYTIIALLGLSLIPLNQAYADHFDYGGTMETHGQCIAECEETRAAAMDSLECNYYGTRDAFFSCDNAATSTRNSCLRSCDSTKSETIHKCRETKREEKKECREKKREDRKECREAKKAEKENCKATKVEEKEACKNLSGKEKRECKKQVRQNKRQCKKDARQAKKACKADAKDDKKECIEAADDRNETCIAEAEDAGDACLDECENVYEASCIEERAAYNQCEPLGQEILSAESSCKTSCNRARDDALEGYNDLCSNDHAGDKGGKITFLNNSGRTLYLFNSSTSIAAGETYEQEFPCNTPRLVIDFYEAPNDDSVNYYHRTIIPVYPCCEELTIEDTVVSINP